jgi:hypothetical protein
VNANHDYSTYHAKSSSTNHLSFLELPFGKENSEENQHSENVFKPFVCYDNPRVLILFRRLMKNCEEYKNHHSRLLQYKPMNIMPTEL